MLRGLKFGFESIIGVSSDIAGTVTGWHSRPPSERRHSPQSWPVTITRVRIRQPMSAAVSVYVVPSGTPIGEQSSPPRPQRSQVYVNENGGSAIAYVPGCAVRVSPSIGTPLIDGALTITGFPARAAPGSTRSSAAASATTPARSTRRKRIGENVPRTAGIVVRISADATPVL